MTIEELHRDRARAGSFGSAAGDYDRYRLSYPEALIGDLAARNPGTVLDVGCGTGKAATALARRGLAVLGVELDERMATVARGHGLDVEIAAFETWDAAGRTFDLLTCADAWHWINPAEGVAKAAEILNPGGTAARFWNTYSVSEHVVEALDAVYQQHAPEVSQMWRPRSDTILDDLSGDPFAGDPRFTVEEPRFYGWEYSFTSGEWAGLASTISDHRRLGPERLAALLGAVREAVDELGGTIRSQHETYVLLARKN
ncbi:class I SAM-dependent methyltransferase [Longispora albida]|uniref:class I SAM-dependent methyltransferase n=1 Tax=Longispora albida TaxID=203523 RepID=UPI0012F8A72A|nr:class I SAM-dependent methyltransferase [Longispora albida]